MKKNRWYLQAVICVALIVGFSEKTYGMYNFVEFISDKLAEIQGKDKYSVFLRRVVFLELASNKPSISRICTLIEKHPPTFGHFLGSVDKKGNTLLHHALRLRSQPFLDVLFAMKKRFPTTWKKVVNHRNKEHVTPFALAWEQALQSSFKQSSLYTIKRCIASGAFLDLKNTHDAQLVSKIMRFFVHDDVTDRAMFERVLDLLMRSGCSLNTVLSGVGVTMTHLSALNPNLFMALLLRRPSLYVKVPVGSLLKFLHTACVDDVYEQVENLDKPVTLFECLSLLSDKKLIKPGHALFKMHAMLSLIEENISVEKVIKTCPSPLDEESAPQVAGRYHWALAHDNMSGLINLHRSYSTEPEQKYGLVVKRKPTSIALDWNAAHRFGLKKSSELFPSLSPIEDYSAWDFEWDKEEEKK